MSAARDQWGDARPAGVRFSPRAPSESFWRLPPGALVLAGMSLVGAVALLRSRPGRSGLVEAAAALVVGAFGSLTRIGGRHIVEWAASVIRHTARHAVGRHRMIGAGRRTANAWRRPFRLQPFRLQLGEMEVRGRSVGVSFDPKERTIAAVLSVSGPDFLLADDSARADLQRAWAGALATLASEQQITSLKWVHLRSPDDAERFRSSLAEALRARTRSAALDRAVHSYEQLMLEAERVAFRSEEFVVVSVGTATSRRGTATSRRGTSSLGRLAEALVSTQHQLDAAGLTVRALTREGIVVAIAAMLAGNHHPTGDPWPSSVEERWDHVRADRAFHATYWIGEWPVSEVPAGFLLPLLSGCPTRNAVTLVLQPEHRARARRRAEQRRTNAIASADLRRRYGFQTSSRRKVDEEATARQEAELAAGHAAYRFCGYVTVSAASESELADSCERVELAAAHSQLQLRRLYGEQRAALWCSLVGGRAAP